MKIFNFFQKTSFAPAERKDEKHILSQSENFKHELKDNSILNMIPDPVAILNSERQLIFANKALLNLLGVKDNASVLGLRPGEILDCVHSHNDSGGCGTTEFCSVCGAVKSILCAQKDKSENKSECEIITKEGSAYNFRVWTSPFGENTLFVIRNIADEVYRGALERIFFHDLGNIGSGLFGLLDMIDDNTDTFIKYKKTLKGLALEIVEEINSQRALLQAEKGTMFVRWETFNNVEIIDSIVDMLAQHKVAKGKSIIADKDSEMINIKTDAQLLKRIIINMVKNALEASSEGQCVSIKTISKNDKVIFEVHNDSFIPKETQLQIFNRSFTTKGNGRGLGTYSIKLLSENYLQGKAYFTSDPETGTSFFVEYPIEPKLEVKE